MDGDRLLGWLIIILHLTINGAAIHLNKNNQLHFVWSGLTAVILGPFLAFLVELFL
ncbi:hypothetical protein [Pseudobacillus wudalianchiensis]|uniref:hypothetical protein n=1 Tax=Pseudobacillus wudalianchiensis TaxID=1743143 RepID=UPI00159EFDDB|nr:hypothetical protein [Bacillus wudalianchiensis]